MYWIGFTNAIHIFQQLLIILSQRRLEKRAPDSAWSLDCAGELSKFAENTFYLPFQLVRQGLPSSLSLSRFDWWGLNRNYDHPFIFMLAAYWPV